MGSIVLHITQEWHDKHVEHPSGMGRVPVIRGRGDTILDPEEVKHILATRPHFVIKRAATPDEEAEIAAIVARRQAARVVAE